MNPVFDAHYKKAIDLLSRLSSPDGILASSIAADNYKRIWARDAVVCGLAGLIADQEDLVAGLKRSLDLLAKHQHTLGMIPSNVDPRDGSVSYGSLVGRVDTSSWYVIGACLFYKSTGDDTFWQQHQPHLEKARNYLRSITFNDRAWIYTPLSGNWADEYPVHGYTLYDNSLYRWGESLWEELAGSASAKKTEQTQRLLHNFWPADPVGLHTYQKTSYQFALAQNPKHFGSFILPGKYDLRFDAAANALGLCLADPGPERMQLLEEFVLNDLCGELGQALIPAFWPVIDRQSADWDLLENNYSYEFKNQPGCFHNGGIWPVWMGLFCLGLSLRGRKDLVTKIVESYTALLSQSGDAHFSEYYRSTDLKPDGKKQMGYTASGVVFMKQALQLDSSAGLANLGLK